MLPTIVLALALDSAASAPKHPCTHDALPAHVVFIHPAAGPMPPMNRPYATIVMNVDADGRITDTTIDDSSGNSYVDRLAIAAAKQWTFIPAEVNCKAEKSIVEYAVGFGSDRTFNDPFEHVVAPVRPMSPDFPDDLRTLRGTFVVLIAVTLDEHGRVIDLRVEKSTGYDELDKSALRAAMQSNYFPAVEHGVTKQGSYLFRAEFKS